MRRTAEEIKAEVAALREIKPNTKRASIFGDNHHDAIDAQVETLERRLTETVIDNRRGEEWKDNEADAALDALRWMGGEDLEDGPGPAATWKELAK